MKCSCILYCSNHTNSMQGVNYEVLVLVFLSVKQFYTKYLEMIKIHSLVKLGYFIFINIDVNSN